MPVILTYRHFLNIALPIYQMNRLDQIVTLVSSAFICNKCESRIDANIALHYFGGISKYPANTCIDVISYCAKCAQSYIPYIPLCHIDQLKKGRYAVITRHYSRAGKPVQLNTLVTV